MAFSYMQCHASLSLNGLLGALSILYIYRGKTIPGQNSDDKTKIKGREFSDEILERRRMQ